MSYDEKRKLSLDINRLAGDKIGRVSNKLRLKLPIKKDAYFGQNSINGNPLPFSRTGTIFFDLFIGCSDHSKP